MANKVLVHNYHNSDPSIEFITILLDDKVFRIYPGEPFEVESDSNGRRLDNPDFYAHHIIATFGSIYGIVEVPVVRTRSGITFDVEAAIQLADAALLQNRHRHINLWAADQLTSRVRQNLPVLPPSGFVEESIKILNIDTQKKFGFKPIGWDWRPVDDKPIDSSPATDTDLQVENTELKNRMARLEEALGIDSPTKPRT